jgi:hypothetical protein
MRQNQRRATSDDAGRAIIQDQQAIASKSMRFPASLWMPALGKNDPDIIRDWFHYRDERMSGVRVSAH